jgi:hypothetical protein
MCLIYILDNFHCLWYIHTAKQMKIQPKKIKSNLSAKRSILKPCNFKAIPMTPDFLYNFLTFLQSRIENTLPKKLTFVPMSGANILNWFPVVICDVIDYHEINVDVTDLHNYNRHG